MAAYLVLAVAVTLAYGARGLAVLLLFYFSAAAATAFALAWGSLARAAGRWNAQRLDPPG